MSATWDPLSRALAEQLGWALVHSLWQGAVMAGIFYLLRPVLRNSSSSTRYFTTFGMLVLLAAAPLVSAAYGLLRPHSPQVGGAALGGTIYTGMFSVLGVGGRVENVGGGVWQALRHLSEQIETLLPAAVMVWGVGVVLFSCRFLQGCWWLRRVRNVQVKPVDPAWLAVVEYLKSRLEIRRPVRIMESALASVPMVVGWLRPVILLPTSALTGLSPDQLEAIIAHELAHVRRHDHVLNAFQNVLETLMFYHPAVWWISRCVREERENCCDDLVVGVCEDRKVYVRALFRLEELRGTPSRLAFAASGGSLLQRIRRLLGGAVEPRPVTVREFGGLTLLAVGCAVMLTGAGMLLGRETYASTCRIRVEGQHRLQAMGEASGASPGSYDPYFLQTEFEVMQSQVVLGRVIQQLNLDTVWGKEYGRHLRSAEAMELLKNRLQLRPVRNTTLLEIRAFDEDSEQAARIANAIARTYADYRSGKQERAAGETLEVMVARLKGQDEQISQAQAKVDRLRSELGVSEGASTLLPAESLRRIENLRLETQAELVRSEALWAKLKALDPSELPQALASSGLQDTLLTEFLAQQTQVEQRLVAMRREYGPEYNDLVRLNGQAEDLKRRVNERVNGIMTGLQARIASTQQGLVQLSNEVQHALSTDVQKANLSQPYFQAKRELEDLQHIRSTFYSKLAEQKNDAALPRSSAVEIIDEALPARRAFSPDRPRAVALILGGLVMSALGFFLVRSGRRQDTEGVVVGAG
jgi:uncharacterized protein involved in exopolysaccharide biosynthesis/beta-lactamase regulating signal transducer with metallopeptidase domain